ncbi:lysozyme, partial [Helicobacter pylori]
MKTSQRGSDLIKQFEGCKLTAYLDSVGVPTIGFGHTKGVKMG